MPIAYLLVTSVKANGQVVVVAYATDASARSAYKRLGGQTPRALVGQPGNRVLGSSDAGQEPSALDASLAAAAAAVGTAQWVVVRRVWERVEASLVQRGHRQPGRGAMAIYARLPGRKAKEAWGANEPAAIESRGRATWLGRSARRWPPPSCARPNDSRRRLVDDGM